MITNYGILDNLMYGDVLPSFGIPLDLTGID